MRVAGRHAQLRIEELDAEHMNKRGYDMWVAEWVIWTLLAFLITCTLAFAIGRQIGQRIHLRMQAIPALVTRADSPHWTDGSQRETKEQTR